jgi:hypothetical protein
MALICRQGAGSEAAFRLDRVGLAPAMCGKDLVDCTSYCSKILCVTKYNDWSPKVCASLAQTDAAMNYVRGSKTYLCTQAL